MKIVWDEPKRLANIAKHDGLDFADLDEAFFERSIVVPGKRDRLIAVGRLANGIVVVVFVALGIEGISIISMRPAPKGKGTPRWLRPTNQARATAGRIGMQSPTIPN